MKNKIFLNNGWLYTNQFDSSILTGKYSGKLEKVRLPHTTAITPFNNFSEKIYQTVCAYITTFASQADWKGKKVLITFEGSAHETEVFVNGKSVGIHCCGYTAFTFDITKYLFSGTKKNTLVVKVDSRETLDIPPFGNVIDYMTFGGIYRDVYLEIKNPVYIENVAVSTKSNHFMSTVTLNTALNTEGYTIQQKITGWKTPNASPSAEVVTGITNAKVLTAANAAPVQAWSLENPALYLLTTELVDAKGKTVDVNTVRFGFRDIRFDDSGFYLNNKKIKLRGLNRHQSWPYVGYAMPKNMQYDDAEILKFELGLNAVRTSHYPQSHYFLDRCDEIGLLVFTEIPGWQYIGGPEWKEQCVKNTVDMVSQYRNHPSIFMWGTRINESADDDSLYELTNGLVKRLDLSRPTSGVRAIKFSRLFEDVYSYNDFSHTGKNKGILEKEKVTDIQKCGYFISEYNGHMFPTKSFDDEKHRTEQAQRHASVLNAVAGDEKVAGSTGWCAFDYNTHKEFGSGDRICYHGVMDMFRNPKIAASVYKSQQEADIVGDVLDVSSSMDIGEYAACNRGPVWIFTNCDSVKLFVNNIFIKQFTKEDSPYKNLPHGPILIDDYIGSRLVNEDHIPAEYAEDVKASFKAVQKYGEDNLPLKEKLRLLKLFVHKVGTRETYEKLFQKYVNNWGDQNATFRFEGCREGKVVKTLVKTPGHQLIINATSKTDVLVESNSYDVLAVHFTALDENGNLQSYYQEALSLEVEGPVEIIGPKIVSLKGGMAGTYIKSTGSAGKATLYITDCDGNQSRMFFTVKVQKV